VKVKPGYIAPEEVKKYVPPFKKVSKLISLYSDCNSKRDRMVKRRSNSQWSKKDRKSLIMVPQ
jgi:hypothetical protein